METARQINSEILKIEGYWEKGLTPVVPVFDPTVLQPLQEIIYDCTKHLLGDHDSTLPVSDRVRLGFVNPSSKEDVQRLVDAVESSTEFTKVISHQDVQSAFRRAFGVDQVERFPISRFRAQFPGLVKTTYDWHQDEGTWYAIKAKNLAHKMPATLWLSINGADTSNSIELIAGSHKCGLCNHYQVSGQGFFNAAVPKSEANSAHTIVETKVGEGVVFHPLTFHRSVRGQSNRPRYSIDVRYFCDRAAAEKYSVAWQLWLKRIFA